MNERLEISLKLADTLLLSFLYKGFVTALLKASSGNDSENPMEPQKVHGKRHGEKSH